MTLMRVLGIDPGTVRMGIGIVEETTNSFKLVACESVKLTESLPLPERLKEIHEVVRGFLDRYQPEVVALENVFYGKNVRTLVRVGEARASAMLAAAGKGIPVREYPPARIKQAITGNGQASKVQVQHMVKNLLGLRETPEVDAADALAAALCHLQSAHVRIPVG